MSIRRVLHRLLNCWGRPGQDQGLAVTPSRGGDPSPATRRQFLTGLLSLPVAAVGMKFFPQLSQPSVIYENTTPVSVSSSLADGKIEEIENLLTELWSNYSCQPDVIWMSPQMAEKYGFRTIEGPYYDPHYVGSFANSNV